MPNTPDPLDIAGLTVTSRVVRLEPGLFALSLAPGSPASAAGLPAVRVSTPPNLAGQRETVSISPMRADGWMTAQDEPTLLRAGTAGGLIMVTLYWTNQIPGTQLPALTLERINPGATHAGASPAPSPGAAPDAEIVAHIQERGDIEARFGDWVGQRGSGRAIEGFSLTPRAGITPEDFELRAVLGRDWLSPWLPGGRFCGSRGLALPLRGFCLRLRGGAAARYNFAAFAHFVDGTEAGPIGSDQVCVSPSFAPLEAFQVSLRPRLG